MRLTQKDWGGNRHVLHKDTTLAFIWWAEENHKKASVWTIVEKDGGKRSIQKERASDKTQNMMVQLPILHINSKYIYSKI
jgi:hypothetical protein